MTATTKAIHPSVWRKGEGFGTLFLITCAAVLPFITTLGFGFVYDDDIQVLANPVIRAWRFVPAYFVKPIAGFYTGAASARYYRPVFFLWLKVNYFFWGMLGSGWHATNIALHAAASLLVFSVLRRYFKDARCALFGALIFAAHPVHIETVAWISGCTDALMTVAVLSSLYLWMRNCEAPSSLRRIASLACCAVALLTKETALILPAIIFFHGFLGIPVSTKKSKASLNGAVRETIPYLAVAVAYLILRSWVLRELPSAPHWISAKQAVLTMPLLALFYIRTAVWPWSLSLFYDFTLVSKVQSHLFWAPAVALIAISTGFYAWWRQNRDSRIIAAALWFVLPLAPVLYIRVFQQDDFVHDRYLYLSILGLSIAFGILVEFARKRMPDGMPPSLPLIGATSTIVILALATAIQARPWKNNLTLYTNTVKVAPLNTMARNNLADQYARIGRYAEAGELLMAVLQERPEMWLANYNYGFVNYRLGNFSVAEQYLRRAVGIDPSDPDQFIYLGTTYLKEGRLNEAREQVRRAIARRPDGTGYHFLLATIEIRQGNLPSAREEMLTELKYHPDLAVVRAQLQAMDKQSGSTAP